MHLKETFIGSWSLKEWKYTRSGRADSFPYGKEASGMLLYTDQGTMSAILMEPGRVADSASGYVSYGGRFTANPETIEHHVECSLRPGWTGQVLTRYYKFSNDGNTLVLTTAEEMNAKGEAVQNVLTWVRDGRET